MLRTRGFQKILDSPGCQSVSCGPINPARGWHQQKKAWAPSGPQLNSMTWPQGAPERGSSLKYM